MTPNITAMSSASPPPINADRRPKANPAESTAPASADGGVRAPTPDAAAVPAASATPPAATTASKTDAVAAPAASATSPAATAALNPQLLAAAVDTINTSLKGLQQTNLQFNIDEESGEMVVKVMDVEKDEVIRQIPPKEVLALAVFFKEAEAKKSQGMELTALGARGSATGSAMLEGLLLRAKV